MNKVVRFFSQYMSFEIAAILALLLVYVLFDPIDRYMTKDEVKARDFSTLIWSDSVKLNGKYGLLMHQGKNYVFLEYDSLYCAYSKSKKFRLELKSYK